MCQTGVCILIPSFLSPSVYWRPDLEYTCLLSIQVVYSECKGMLEPCAAVRGNCEDVACSREVLLKTTRTV